ncbi:zinc-ribbon domain-containing protein [Thermophilibacter sp.]
MFCPKCGAQVPDGTRFCPACGASLNPAGAPAGGATPGAPGPVVTPGATATGNASTLRLVRLVAAVVMIVAFFLPLVGTSVFGYEFSVSALNVAFGIDVFGSHLDGNLVAILFVVPGIVALVGALLAKDKVADIVAIVCGAALLLMLAYVVWYANDAVDGYVPINLLVGAWLCIISGIASIVGGALGLVKK